MKTIWLGGFLGGLVGGLISTALVHRYGFGPILSFITYTFNGNLFALLGMYCVHINQEKVKEKVSDSV